MARRTESLARGLDPDQLDRRITDERMEDPHRVRASADARDDSRREMTHAREHLRARFAADDRLEVAHHARIRRRTDHRTDDVV